MTAHLPVDRREFVNTCAAVLLVPLLGACASLAAHPVEVDRGRIRLRVADHAALAQQGGALKILPAGAKDPLYVLHLAGGTFAVLSPICTHRGCTVEVQGARMVCPCHGSTYDHEGRVLRGPAEEPLQRYAATLANGVLDIELASAR